MANPVALRPERPAPLSNPTVITVGRLAPEKNHEALIEAFARLAATHPQWRLKIFGDGNLRDSLADYSRERGVADRVLLPGPTEQVERELQDSSIFALSSDAEGLPLALIEAMTCGVPCVSFDCSPGIREIITDGVDGIVVAQGSITELSEGLRRLMDQSEERHRMGAAAFESAKRFSADQILDRWEELFDVVER
jgi:glycosyltransferase involved in cell wall biosynthesis